MLIPQLLLPQDKRQEREHSNNHYLTFSLDERVISISGPLRAPFWKVPA
jgi:hypothetical protein